MGARVPQPPRRSAALPLWLGAALLRLAADEPARLPPVDARPIRFREDIQPILQESCIRCHGVERPKSGFRLTDRASALKGGARGVDILPGRSAESPLIQFVTGQVEDMQMPPPDKGKPLTPDQVGLLRAWIDQGVSWDDTAATNTPSRGAEAMPFVEVTAVSGNEAKFNEIEGRPAGWDGGVESFRIWEAGRGGSSAEARGSLRRNDYRVTLELQKPDLGFTRFGYQQFREYGNAMGGYYAPFDPPAYAVNDSLHLDVGRAWVELGWTPPDRPRLVLGYEYRFRDGDKPMLSWGSVGAPGGDFRDSRNIYPSVKSIDERTQVLRLDVDYELAGVLLQDNFRAEFEDLSTRQKDALYVPAGQAAPVLASRISQSQNDVELSNAFRATTAVTDWWQLSAGYRYASLNGSAAFRLETLDDSGRPAAGDAWTSQDIVLDRVSQTFNLSSQWQPANRLTLTLGLQGEWSHQDTFGDLRLNVLEDPNDPTAGLRVIPAVATSTLDQAWAEENLVSRYTGLPYTVLFAEVRLSQGQWTQSRTLDGGDHAFLLDTDATSRRETYRVGFTLSPWPKLSLHASYAHRHRLTDYDPTLDEHPLGSGSSAGYPAFISARELAANEVGARLVYRPGPRLRTGLGIQWFSTDYHTTTDATSQAEVGDVATPGGSLQAGEYRAWILSADALVTPLPRLYVSAAFAYQPSELTTATHGDPSVVPYQGAVETVFATVGYAIDAHTDIFARYQFSHSNYGQDNAAAGLPLGLDHSHQSVQAGVVRQLGRHAAFRLQYGFYQYEEPSAGGLPNYTAQQVLAALNVGFGP